MISFDFYIYLAIYIVRITNFSSHNKSTVEGGVTTYLINLTVIFRFNRSKTIMSVLLCFLNLFGLLKNFSTPIIDQSSKCQNFHNKGCTDC